MSLGPFDLTGGPFLALYSVLLVITIITGFTLPRWLQPEGRRARLADPDRLAYLAGGSMRFVDTVVVRLMAGRALSLVDKREFRADPRSGARSDAERRVLALPAPLRWKAIERTLTQAATPIGRRLIADGLLLDNGAVLRLRFWQTLPYFLLIGFGATKWVIGDLRGKPVGFLSLLLILTAILTLIRFVAVSRRTRTGDAALAEARAGAERIRRAPMQGEADLAVALFGVAVLAGTPYADFHTLRSGSGDSGGSSGSDGSGDGGSGCGGGGGGGCGGCSS